MDYKDGYLAGYSQGYEEGFREASRISVRGIVPTLPQEVEPAAPSPKKRKRRDRKLSAAFKEANARLRTKSGKLRKGKTQSDVARLAQRLRKKM